MAPLPQNNTARVFFDYQTNTSATGRSHTLQWRIGSSGIDITTVMDGFLGYLTAFGAANFRGGWRVTGARIQQAGAAFSVPVTLSSGVANFVGTNSAGYTPRHEAVEDVYVGRSGTSGRRWEFSIYRASGDADPNFRYVTATAVRNALIAAANANVLLCIDGSIPTIYTYTNQNYNSYWEARSRTV